MLVPRIFTNNFFDDFLDDFPTFSSNFENMGSMKTDIKDLGENYEIDIEMPGVAKENVHAELKKGYLTVSANTEKNTEEKDEAGKYLRRERYTGSMSRSFYVGNGYTEEDIAAKFENGVLKLTMPKAQPQVEQNAKTIMIED